MSGDRWVYEIEPGGGDPSELVSVAERAVARGDRELAATAYDRAYALSPDAAAVASARASLLDSLAVRTRGLRFRYVPAGCYLMGSLDSDPDERPVHYVRLGAFWVSETPVSWAAYCALMGWEPPPHGAPSSPAGEPRDGFRKDVFHLAQESKIRLQYCESFTTRALDWHAHASGGEMFGRVPRSDPGEPLSYDAKPMVAVSWQAAEQLASRLSDDSVTYRLPTEAEWEAAARGGLAGRRYPWGDEPPDPQGCDFGRFDEFSIRPSRSLPPNGYGLYGMSGGVWEWTADWYDALYYAESPRVDPVGPEHGKQKVLRGGSWADCAETATVSFRFARESAPWWEEEWGRHVAPNIGFRLCRVEKPLPGGSGHPAVTCRRHRVGQGR